MTDAEGRYPSFFIGAESPTPRPKKFIKCKKFIEKVAKKFKVTFTRSHSF